MSRDPSIILDDFAGILAQVREAIDLEASARAHGAFLRPRKIASAEELFRLALAYGCGQSLRTSSGFAQASGIAEVSPPGLLNRFANCAGWLEAIALALLQKSQPQAAGAFAGQRLSAVDATSISHAGAKAGSFKLHLRFGLDGTIEALDLSGGAGGERLSRFGWEADDVVLADRGLARAPELQKLVETGTGFILRAGWNAFKWLDKDGEPLDIAALLKTPVEAIRAEPVRIEVKSKGEPARCFSARLIIVPLPEDKAEAARKKARKRARKGRKKLDPRTLLAAGFSLVLTNLPERFEACEVAGFYRLRWQIELLFKRLKSLSGLGQLPAKDPKLARTWIFAKLIVAILAETAARKLADSPPSGPACALPDKAGMGAGELLPRPHPRRHPRPAQAHGLPAHGSAQ